ncbi:hypothetical protein N7466_000389 [Penicillium verhagenii]|uniref:uncharacterized protein n=1 Tax=Penicillium verhagenii TaxID=1562060 RepID=UPI00254592A0|nr:uncharacterized protein N7466_000389 [Penicillium verhagenii]KAJ5947374.1 hypothetical protein N7466_000389 [Penicillium verhagenii]
MLVEGVSEPESLHPILKPPQASHSEPPKTTRILITQPDGEEITQNPSNSPTPSIVEPKGSIPDRLTPRRSSLVIPGHSKRGGKRRPVMTARRKSSQGVVPKAQGTPKKHNGKSKNTGPTEEIFDDDDDMTSERTKPKSIHRRSTRDATWADLDHDQPYLDFPVTGLTPAATSLLKDGKSGHPAITITPADLPFTDLRFPEPHDPILSQSQGVQTVSDKPDQRSQATQTEIQDNSLSNNIPGPYDFRPYKPVKRTPVPGYHDATRTPMPRAMTEALVDTILDNTPLKGFIPAPDRPLHYFNHPWHELPRPNFLFDFMIKAPSPSNHQPSRRSLVPKNFRQEWTDFIAEENLLLAESIAENEAAKESLSFIQEGRRLCQGTSTQFDSDSEISRGLSSREMPSQELQAHQTTRQQQSDTPSEIDIDQILRELQAEYSSC